MKETSQLKFRITFRDFNFVFVQELDCLQLRGTAREYVIFGTFSST